MDIKIARQIGQVVRKQRKASGLTQSELAEKAHVDRSLIIRLESGEAKSLYPEKLLSILSVLDLKMVIEPRNKQTSETIPNTARTNETLAEKKEKEDALMKHLINERIGIVHGIDANLLLPRHIKKSAK